MNLELKDENSTYLGDGAYTHIDPYGRLWVVTYNGISIDNKVCLEWDRMGFHKIIDTFPK